ncbi:alkB, alkylation repair protein 6 [Phyllosticta capitalensis]
MADDFSGERLEAARIPDLPDAMYYIADFISAYEEEQILAKLPPKRWTTLSHRRLQAHPSTLTASNTLLAAPLPAYLTSSPAPLAARFEQLGIFALTPHRAPNHCLVNEYRRGEGIMAHEDGAAYAPVVATVSLGGTVVLEVTPKRREDGDGDGERQALDGPAQQQQQQTRRIVCAPRSLLVTVRSAYTTTLHGIPDVEADEDLGPATVANWELLGDEARTKYEEAGGRNERGTRVSLTFRDVLKVAKAGGLGKILGGGGKRLV